MHWNPNSHVSVRLYYGSYQGSGGQVAVAGHVAIVTGANHGIGAATSIALA